MVPHPLDLRSVSWAFPISCIHLSEISQDILETVSAPVRAAGRYEFDFR